MNRAGFTLVELVVALGVLALLTHVGLREFARLRGARLHAAADRQLEALRDAVWSCGADGEPVGFLADVGRLPQLVAETNAAGETVHTLGELWVRPPEIGPYAVLAATAANLRVPAADKADLADGNVRVGAGWRGPYHRLAFGKTRLFDPWGNPLEKEDDAGYARLALTNGASVCGVRHFGSDARPDGTDASAGDPDEKDGEISLAPPGGGSARLTVTVQVIDGDGADVNPGPLNPKICWYGPCGSAITGACARAVTADFAGLTPGMRAIRASCDGVPPVVRMVQVRPGSNGPVVMRMRK